MCSDFMDKYGDSIYDSLKKHLDDKTVSLQMFNILELNYLYSPLCPFIRTAMSVSAYYSAENLVLRPFLFFSSPWELKALYRFALKSWRCARLATSPTPWWTPPAACSRPSTTDQQVQRWTRWSTGCSGKIMCFIIHCNPSLAYILLQEVSKALSAMWMYCTVTPIGWPISVQPIEAQG